MLMMISALEKANPSDRDEIVSLFQNAVDHLNQSGILQWDEVYPNVSNVEVDIQNAQLYVVRAKQQIAGVITINQVSDWDYQNAKWQYQGPDFAVVHRLCVSPSMQGYGLGSRMMQMAEAMLRENGIKSIRLDVFSQNPYSLRLYEKLGFRTVGEAMWRKGLFYLMEKAIHI